MASVSECFRFNIYGLEDSLKLDRALYIGPQDVVAKMDKISKFQAVFKKGLEFPVIVYLYQQSAKSLEYCIGVGSRRFLSAIDLDTTPRIQEFRCLYSKVTELKSKPVNAKEFQDRLARFLYLMGTIYSRIYLSPPGITEITPSVNDQPCFIKGKVSVKAPHFRAFFNVVKKSLYDISQADSETRASLFIAWANKMQETYGLIKERACIPLYYNLIARDNEEWMDAFDVGYFDNQLGQFAERHIQLDRPVKQRDKEMPAFRQALKDLSTTYDKYDAQVITIDGSMLSCVEIIDPKLHDKPRHTVVGAPLPLDRGAWLKTAARAPAGPAAPPMPLEELKREVRDEERSAKAAHPVPVLDTKIAKIRIQCHGYKLLQYYDENKARLMGRFSIARFGDDYTKVNKLVCCYILDPAFRGEKLRVKEATCDLLTIEEGTITSRLRFQYNLDKRKGLFYHERDLRQFSMLDDYLSSRGLDANHQEMIPAGIRA